MQEHERSRDDFADLPRAEADVTQGFEGHFEEGVPAFADGTDWTVPDLVDTIHNGQWSTGRGRDGKHPPEVHARVQGRGGTVCNLLRTTDRGGGQELGNRRRNVGKLGGESTRKR